jgi:hypothetical protein
MATSTWFDDTPVLGKLLVLSRASCNEEEE